MAAKKKAKTVKAKEEAPKRKLTAVKESMSKSAIMNEIAENTGITKKQVTSVFDELNALIERHVKKRSPGKFTLPGILKIEVKKKPARKARKGVNPFTGEEMTFKAKPAQRAVKIRPLKKLKEMAE
ncbi:MAG: HU family DNA-binding protein [Deltaproteobacteria bacterium]|nr:HU family DNA-binding protein [Deltaproteobacteria bacterium]MBW1817518.1 HU family DNA-binding protein [Deltaproteobacteria bacterium]